MKMMGFLQFLLGLSLMITIMASTPVVEAWGKEGHFMVCDNNYIYKLQKYI